MAIALALIHAFCSYLHLPCPRNVPMRNANAGQFIALVGFEKADTPEESRAMTQSPMQLLNQAMRQHGLVRFLDHYARQFAGCHLKDVTVTALGPHREMEAQGRWVVNFGSDSFLGLDQDARVQEALVRGVHKWGAHNGASRAFCSVHANEVAEQKLARWLGTEDALIYASVSLANMGALP